MATEQALQVIQQLADAFSATGKEHAIIREAIETIKKELSK